MAKWTDYTTDTNPTDTDEVMTLDADKSPKVNKRVTLSTLADYFLDKLASKVFAKLETQNKTVIGALNELNSKTPILINTENDFIHNGGGKYEYSGVKISIPKGSLAIINFSASWISAKATGVALADSDAILSDSTVYSKYEGVYPISNSYIYITEKELTLHVWAKYDLAGTETCKIRGLIFNQNSLPI